MVFAVEVVPEAKDVATVLFEDAIGEKGFGSLESELKKKTAKARALLDMCLSPKALLTIAVGKKNPYRMYRRLEDRYATKMPANRVQLQTQLHQMKYDPSKFMSGHIDSLEGIFNHLAPMESPVNDAIPVSILLESLRTASESAYGSVLFALQTLADDKLTWEAVSARLLQE